MSIKIKAIITVKFITRMVLAFVIGLVIWFGGWYWAWSKFYDSINFNTYQLILIGLIGMVFAIALLSLRTPNPKAVTPVSAKTIKAKELMSKYRDDVAVTRARRIDITIPEKIGIVFLILGIASFLLSIYSESTVLAFIGLGLAFWGVLFFFARPSTHGRHAEGSLLNMTAITPYLTIDRIIKDFKFKGKGYYIPPYTKEVFLPRYLEGLQDSVVFISAEDKATLPSIEEMAEGKFFVKKPKGMLLFPPGLGLQAQIEKKISIEKQIAMDPVLAPKMELGELCEVLPSVILDDLNLVKDVVMTLEEKRVILKIRNSVYQNLYDSSNNIKSIKILGCPILSAVASIIAKTSGKPVVIGKLDISPDGSSIWAFFSIIEE